MAEQEMNLVRLTASDMAISTSWKLKSPTMSWLAEMQVTT